MKRADLIAGQEYGWSRNREWMRYGGPSRVTLLETDGWMSRTGYYVTQHKTQVEADGVEHTIYGRRANPGERGATLALVRMGAKANTTGRVELVSTLSLIGPWAEVNAQYQEYKRKVDETNARLREREQERQDRLEAIQEALRADDLPDTATLAGNGATLPLSTLERLLGL